MLLSSLGHRLISQELRTTTPTTHHASNQTSYIYLVDHPRFTSRVTPSPISLTVDDLPKQTRNTWLLQMPGVTFGAIFRGTEKPDPTAARLCAKIPSFQFGACDRKGATGSARGWACPTENLCRRKSPQAFASYASTNTHHKLKSTRTQIRVPVLKIFTS